MEIYIALLRGINVGGKHRIAMADLKALMAERGYSDIETYIQSGNIVFCCPGTTTERAQRDIAQAIEARYGFAVPTIVRTRDEFAAIVDTNPFLAGGEANTEALHVTLLAEEPTADAINALAEKTYSPEEYVVRGTTVYLFCPNGYGRAVLNNNFLEKKLRVLTTTRNWKTMCTLAEMARNKG